LLIERGYLFKFSQENTLSTAKWPLTYLLGNTGRMPKIKTFITRPRWRFTDFLSYNQNSNSSFYSWNTDLSYNWWFAQEVKFLFYIEIMRRFEREINKDFGTNITDLLNNGSKPYFFYQCSLFYWLQQQKQIIKNALILKNKVVLHYYYYYILLFSSDG
jgi:hypothetical protein